MIDFAKAQFLKSVTELSLRPEKRLDEVLFVGKSNVGKSSLINALTHRTNLAKVSSKPGHTKLLNYYLIDEKFYLVDAPGYGYTISGTRHLEAFGEMMEEYFSSDNLRLVVFLLDGRHEASRDDMAFLSFLKESEIAFIIVFTKCDKLNQSERAKLKKRISANFGAFESVSYSLSDNSSIESVKRLICSHLDSQLSN